MPDHAVEVRHAGAVCGREKEIGVRSELPLLSGVPDLQPVILEGGQMRESGDEERIDILRLVRTPNDAAGQDIALLVARIWGKEL